MQTLFGLVGKSLSHSLSQVYFREKFRQLRLSTFDYRLFEIDSIDRLPYVLNSHQGIRGFNVTVPYKEDVIKFLDGVDAMASDVGAVNTVSIESGKLIGYNTDVIGFEKLLLPLLEKAGHQGSKALVLGTGGSSKAVCHVLRKHNVDVALVTSTPHRNILTYEELTEAVVANHRFVINTTPLGMFPNVASFPDIPYNALTSRHVLIDLVYNPLETQFLKFGSAKRATCVNGLTMLYAQADAAWEIWKANVLR